MSIKIALEFLKKLEKNNNREWFAENKSNYDAALKATKAVFNEMYLKMQVHDELDKMKLFRIYRDVRFSKNKLPYKNNFGGTFHRVKPRLRGGYYVQIQPGNNFIACGFWDPNKADLLRIRKEFEMDDDEINTIINDSKFKAVWGELKGDELKTAPRNFDKDHEAINLIKKKQYIFTKQFTDAEVCKDDFALKVNDYFKTIRPFFDYMSDVLTTDLNGVSLIKD
ncbi:TIGR02453 family protein [Gaetbulibacter sp. 5U11]|nr:TIGR02453 family protein [Gaetbulibacter sp. 5U11]